MINALVVLAETTAEHAEGGGPNAYVVGFGTFGLLLAALVALMVFGGGREHS
jgi:hypothetical protein